jgi:hypothetical protein
VEFHDDFLVSIPLGDKEWDVECDLVLILGCGCVEFNVSVSKLESAEEWSADVSITCSYYCENRDVDSRMPMVLERGIHQWRVEVGVESCGVAWSCVNSSEKCHYRWSVRESYEYVRVRRWARCSLVYTFVVVDGSIVYDGTYFIYGVVLSIVVLVNCFVFFGEISGVNQSVKFG